MAPQNFKPRWRRNQWGKSHWASLPEPGIEIGWESPVSVGRFLFIFLAKKFSGFLLAWFFRSKGGPQTSEDFGRLGDLGLMGIWRWLGKYSSLKLPASSPLKIGPVWPQKGNSSSKHPFCRCYLLLVSGDKYEDVVPGRVWLSLENNPSNLGPLGFFRSI